MINLKINLRRLIAALFLAALFLLPWIVGCAVILLGCAPVINVPPINVRIVREIVPTDTVWVERQAVVITNKNSLSVPWDEYVRGLKDTLFVHAVTDMRMWPNNSARGVGWSGDFIDVIHLELAVWRKGLPGVKQMFFTWNRHPIKGIWIMKEEEE